MLIDVGEISGCRMVNVVQFNWWMLDESPELGRGFFFSELF